MTTPIQQSGNPSQFQRIADGCITGGKIMLLQTPLVTALNRTSVVCCYKNLSTLKAIQAIYSGTIDHAVRPSTLYFFKGVSGHFLKETPRVIFKSVALINKPLLDRHFQNDPHGKIKSDLIFAGGISLSEMAINPADTLRTMWQSGQKASSIAKGKMISHFYKGSGANGLRVFFLWLGYPFSERVWTHILKDKTSIDPHSTSGIVLKAFPQAFQIYTPIWIFERLKYELQYHPDIPIEKNGSRYVAAFKHIIHTQGVVGLSRGFLPKIMGSALAAMGANILHEQGKKC